MMKKCKELLESAEAILIFAGAGMSEDSGLPTFRDKDSFCIALHPCRSSSTFQT